jgi:integrase
MTLKLVPPRGTRKCWAVRGTVNGERIERTTGCTVRREAEIVLKRMQKEADQDRLRLPSDPTFDDACRRYLRDARDGRFLERIKEEIGNTPLKLIDQDTVDDLAWELYPEGSPATRNRQVYTPIIAVLRHSGIGTLIKRPKGAGGEQRDVWLWPQDTDKLITAAWKRDPELAVMLILILSTGVRLSEALGLNCTDLRLTERHAFVRDTKNGESRSLYITDTCFDALLRHPRGLKRDSKLFRFYRGSAFYKLLKQAYADAGVDHQGAPVHILRHTYATWMKRYGGATDRDLLETGAWKDLASVRRYSHMAKDATNPLADKLPVPRLGYPTSRQINTQETPTDGC